MMVCIHSVLMVCIHSKIVVQKSSYLKYCKEVAVVEALHSQPVEHGAEEDDPGSKRRGNLYKG